MLYSGPNTWEGFGGLNPHLKSEKIKKINDITFSRDQNLETTFKFYINM